MYANYPAWRHGAFAVVDSGIAYLAFTRTRRVFFPVLAFLIEQVLVNGTYAWRTWRTSGEVLWTIPVMIVTIGAAAAVALQERYATGGSRSANRDGTERASKRERSGGAYASGRRAPPPDGVTSAKRDRNGASGEARAQ